MRYYYDLHIHTALSPCGDEDMTPNNIVNMAILKGLDIIAVTDHNSAENAAAIVNIGRENGILVVPGMEIETAEEIHITALFPDTENLMNVQKTVYTNMNGIKNREEIFGRQLVLDENDEITGNVEQLLITATFLSIEEVFAAVEAAGGVCVPAHVDRSSHSVISNLGMIPEDLPVKNIEISKKCNEDEFFGMYPQLKEYGILRSSDAHYLWDISERVNYIEAEELKSAKDLVDLLREPLKTSGSETAAD